MNVEIRTCRDTAELGAAMSPLWHYFGRAASEEDAKRFERILPVDRVHAAFADGSIVGGAGAFRLEITVPGAVVPMAGVMAVGVLPTHRRRGILTALMRRQLDEIHERGEALAMLYASEGAIYRRYGYGLASLQGDLAVARAHAVFDRPAEAHGTARIVGYDEALELMPPVYDRVQAESVGMLRRSRDWWEARRVFNPPSAKGEQVRVVVEAEGRPEAYALYRVEFAVERMSSKSVVEVVEAIGTTAAATREIWRYLLSIDRVETIRAGFLPPDHPLFLFLAEPRRLNFTLGEALWVRLVDVAAALSARSYAADDELVLEVADAFCPWNDGRWRLAGGEAEPTDAEPDLRLGVDALASAFLGGFTFDQLARAGRVEELRVGTMSRADALFRTPRLPWCPEIF